MDWQIELCRAHSAWLEGGYAPMAVGDGWAPIMRALCDRIAIELVGQPPGTRLRVEAKEKHGNLDFSWMGAVDEKASLAIDRHVLHAEMRASCTCDVCGEAGRLRSTRPDGGGWLAVRCTDHSDGYGPPIDRPGERWRYGDSTGRYDAVYDREADKVTLKPAPEDED